MHPSFSKNVRDYCLYFLITAGTISCVIISVGIFISTDTSLIALSVGLVTGLASSISVAIRDGQHRQISWVQSGSPRQFAREVEIALDSGLTQLQEAERVAVSLHESAVQMSAAMSQSAQLMAGPETATAGNVQVQRGFE